MLNNARQRTLVSNMPCTWPISYYFYLFLSLFTYYYFLKKILNRQSRVKANRQCLTTSTKTHVCYSMKVNFRVTGKSRETTLNALIK